MTARTIMRAILPAMAVIALLVGFSAICQSAFGQQAASKPPADILIDSVPEFDPHIKAAKQAAADIYKRIQDLEAAKASAQANLRQLTTAKPTKSVAWAQLVMGEFEAEATFRKRVQEAKLQAERDYQTNLGNWERHCSDAAASFEKMSTASQATLTGLHKARESADKSVEQLKAQSRNKVP